MPSLSTLPKGDSAWLLRKAIERIMQQVSVLETNIGSSTTGNSSNGQVIFNDNGTLRGDADMTFNVALNKFIVSSLEVPTTATITGDLTVRTTGLVVNATGTGVQVSPSAPLCVKTRNSDSVGLRVLQSTGGTAGIQFTDDPVTADWGSILATSANIILRSNSFLQFQTGGATERMRIDTSGNVGIGVTPSAWDAGLSPIELKNGSVVGFAGSVANYTSNAFYQAAWKYKTTAAAAYYQQANGSHVWNIAPSGTAGNAITWTQAMTLDASGNLLVGVTTTGNRLDVQKSTDCTVLVKSTGANANVALDYVSTYGNHTIRKNGTAVWDFGVINDASATPAFKVSNASAVGVQLVSGATSWTTLSDETMKDIIEPISNAVAKVGSLRSVIGKFKTDDSGKRRSFLIAQDVQSVLPEAVDVIGENNELGLRYTEVIPLLVAAIKELTAEVNALKNA